MMVSFSTLIYIEDENGDESARKINGLQTQASNLETEMQLVDMSNASSLTKKGKLPPLKKEEEKEAKKQSDNEES
jgi:hypothetical protein